MTFAGMLATTGSMRASLAATLFLLFLVMAIFVLNIGAFGRAVSGNDFTKSVFQTLTAGFTTVLAFYFGSEAYVTATRIKEREQTKRARARGGGGGQPPGGGGGTGSGG